MHHCRNLLIAAAKDREEHDQAIWCRLLATAMFHLPPMDRLYCPALIFTSILLSQQMKLLTETIDTPPPSLSSLFVDNEKELPKKLSQPSLPSQGECLQRGDGRDERSVTTNSDFVTLNEKGVSATAEDLDILPRCQPGSSKRLAHSKPRSNTHTGNPYLLTTAKPISPLFVGCLVPLRSSESNRLQ